MRHATMLVSVAVLTCVLFQTAHAQLKPQLGINFIAASPQNDFNRTLGSEGFGLNLSGGVGFGTSPIAIGLDLGFLIYGIEQRREPLSVTIPDLRAKVRTTNNILNAHFTTKYQHRKGGVRPYAEGLIGLKYLYTTTSIANSGGSDEEGGISSKNLGDTALSYGFGTGVDVALWTGLIGGETVVDPEGNTIKEGGALGSLVLNIGVRYLWGGEAEYLRKGAITRGEGTYTMNPSRSTTDILVPQLGVALSY